jgi:PKD repeat protein
MNASSRIGVLYDFTKPGRYTVQLSKYIGNKEKKNSQVKTFTITVTE